MYFVYILQSEKDHRFYIGSTADIVLRLKYHNDGLNKSTKGRRPLILVYQEAFENRAEALRREKQIKNFKGGNEFRKLQVKFRGGVA